MADKLIAVTGGIGSGKSQAINILKENGYNVLSCDKITWELYQKIEIRALLKTLFPDAVTGENLDINKELISKKVFSDKSLLNALNDLITPLVLEEALKQASLLDGKVFIEVPLLFEKNSADKFDHVIVIMRNLDDRISSVIKRSNLTKEQVQARINGQCDYDKLDLSAYHVVFNDKSIGALSKSLLKLAENI